MIAGIIRIGGTYVCIHRSKPHRCLHVYMRLQVYIFATTDSYTYTLSVRVITIQSEV